MQRHQGALLCGQSDGTRHYFYRRKHPEANYAHGKADFIAKLQIALKESYEAEYWMEVFVRAEIVPAEQMCPLYQQCGTIRRLLVTSVNTAKNTSK